MLTKPFYQQFPGVILLIGLSVGCGRLHDDPAPAPSGSTTVGPVRGEHVVVEQNAAEFFEGRMLELVGDRARVQMLTSGETKVVALGDVYSLATASAKSKSGDYAICKLPDRWDACKVEEARGPLWAVVSAEGASSRVEPRWVLAPTPVTQLNLERRFERAKDRAEFDRGLSTAGAPAQPQGWKPGPSERVLVQLEGGWFSGAVYELRKHELRITWQEGKRVSEVTRDRVIPMPSRSGAFRRGDYVLARPVSVADAWQPARVESVDDTGLVVRDRAGAKRTLTVVDLVALVPKGSGVEGPRD